MENAYYLKEFAKIMDEFGILTWKAAPPSTSVDFMDLTILIGQSRLVTKNFEKGEPLPLFSPFHSTHDWNDQRYYHKYGLTIK